MPHTKENINNYAQIQISLFTGNQAFLYKYSLTVHKH